MYTNFRTELAKLFFIVATGVVLVSGLAAHVVISALIFKVIIGGVIFAIVGFLLGQIIDQKKDVQLVELQKQKIKARIKANYDQASKNGDNMGEQFAAMEVDKLTKIIVESMED